jgi:hypothetical protein
MSGSNSSRYTNNSNHNNSKKSSSDSNIRPAKRNTWKVEDGVDWTSSELAQLERVVFHENTIDSEQMAMAERFVKISALFPTKCIRDIALKVTQIKKARTSGSLTIGLPSAAACVSSDKDEWIQKSLKENVELINAIRDNLRQDRLNDNAELYANFRSNIRSMSSWIETLGLNLPEMSVRMTSIFEPSTEKGTTVGQAARTVSQGKSPSNGGVLVSPAGNPMERK